MFDRDEAIESLIWQASHDAEKLSLPVAIVNRDEGLMIVNLADTVESDVILEVFRPSCSPLKTAHKTPADTAGKRAWVFDKGIENRKIRWYN